MTIKPINECKTVAELLEDPGRWTKKANARTWWRFSTDPNASNARCWCIMGAIQKIYGPGRNAIEISRISNCLPSTCGAIVPFNDHPNTTHAEVLDAVRKAGI